ncbi:MAG: amidohydrolase family protein [Planctomycetota bacterium]
MTPHPPTDQIQTIRIDAAAIADAVSGVVTDASVVIRRSPRTMTVLYAGPAGDCPIPDRAPDLTPDQTLRLPDRLLMPGLVNAHTHLDLSHIGPLHHDPGHGFVAWVDHIRSNRRQDDDSIADAVRLGIERSIAGGTVAVGDIAGAPGGRLTDAPARTLGASSLVGVSFLEFFGIGSSAPSAADRLSRFMRERLPGIRASLKGSGVAFGLQPHAPNTVDAGLYRWAVALARSHDLALSTHLAETPEERRFIERGDGPQRELLERVGVWDDSVLDRIGHGQHPVDHLLPVLAERTMLCAHINDAPDRAIAHLAATRTPVVYCPRASAYFGAADHFGPHRYRDMLDGGVDVCLGTDSIVNLDTPDRISVLDEMRLLHRRDATPARTLLTMATTAGARALGLDPTTVTFEPGTILGLIAVPIDPGARDPWADAMAGESAPEQPIVI